MSLLVTPIIHVEAINRFDLNRLHGRDLAVSYQDEALHTGDVYRFDGWRLLGTAGGGGRDSRTGRLGRKMRVWGWPANALPLSDRAESPEEP